MLNRISRFCKNQCIEYKWRDADNPRQWMRTHVSEYWEFDGSDLMRIRDRSANDYHINELERRNH